MYISDDCSRILHKLHHYLPSQASLKDFIHHNPLHGFQNLKFHDAIFKASAIFGYQVTLQLSEYRELFRIGRIRQDILDRSILKSKPKEMLSEWNDRLQNKDYDSVIRPRIGLLRTKWKKYYKTDLDDLVQPLLFRVLCSYLDQGIAQWTFPIVDGGFLASIRALEQDSFTSIFKSKRARDLLMNGKCSIDDLLQLLVGDKELYEQYLFDQQFSHQGWSGIVATIEAQPNCLLVRREITLHDLIVLELLLEIDALDYRFDTDWLPLSKRIENRPGPIFDAVAKSELQEVLTIWQDAFEWSYYDVALAGLIRVKPDTTELVTKKRFQAVFCIDERECSLRRHIEYTEPACETFGTPGFFSVEFYYQPIGGKFYDKLCPAPVTPKYLIKEQGTAQEKKHELLYSKETHSYFIGTVASSVMGFVAALKLVLNVFRPKMSPAISNAFGMMEQGASLTVENKNPADREDGLQIGFTVEEMTVRVESLLRNIGLTRNFAPIVYLVAHGSSSANNPHHGAHDCGACSGRPGSVNARVFAAMANHPAVRSNLLAKGIDIPASTRFIGSLHDTASDQIEYYDDSSLDAATAELHKVNRQKFETALDLNAKERSRRFASIDTKMKLTKIRKAIKDRSVSMFEPRPELGHGTNTFCIVGHRNLTKHLFLDRRAFLNSYDYKADPDGERLIGIMKPLGPVCGGINLEYYFSRVDNHKFGAGTKLPHNVMGLIGVANSSDGDLRPGLPLQMIEVHDPVRLVIIVEHFPEVVLKTIKSAPDMYEWFVNEWVHLVAINPETKELSVFQSGEFTPYTPLTKHVHTIRNFFTQIEIAEMMKTNSIVDSTQENLPVYTLGK